MYELFSVDDHLVEHATVWTDRLPRKYHDRCPRVFEHDGRQSWLIEDMQVDTMGLSATAGKPRSEWKMEPTHFSDMRLGCYDPKARALDMADNGIVASLCFPTLPRFAGIRFLHMKDKELADLCTKAYNDFVLDEWCAAAPELYVPMIIGQVWDVDAMVTEIERCAEKGAKAISFPEFMGPLGLPSFMGDYWDPAFRVLEELDIPLCMHVGTSGLKYQASDDASEICEIIHTPIISAMRSVIAIVTSPMLHKFPKLKIVSSEGGIGWVPNLVERADRIWDQDRHWANVGEVPPSQLVRRNFFFSFVDEPFGIEVRDHIGTDRIMWECDYPHSETPWPHSQKVVEKVMAGLEKEEVEAMLCGNARRVFNWPKSAKGQER
jgi:predicted TIM-barrel fold metal-dependent hydrolase